MAATLETLVEKLKTALGPNLISVVLYGSAATGDHQESFSDYNVLCVLNEISPLQLGATEPVFTGGNNAATLRRSCSPSTKCRVLPIASRSNSTTFANTTRSFTDVM